MNDPAYDWIQPNNVARTTLENIRSKLLFDLSQPFFDRSVTSKKGKAIFAPPATL
jgi:hypothetical protein